MGQSDRIHYHYGAVLPLRRKNASDQQYSGAWNHPAYHGGAVNDPVAAVADLSHGPVDHRRQFGQHGRAGGKSPEPVPL